MKITKLGRAHKKSGYNKQDMNALKYPFQRVPFNQQILFVSFTSCNGAFALPDTETDADTDTDEISTEPNRNLCWCLSLCSVDTSTQPVSIGLCLGFGAEQCEHTISGKLGKKPRHPFSFPIQ